MTTTTNHDHTTKHDAWYLEADVETVDGRRGFSRQILARPDRSRAIPTQVQTIGESFLSDVVDQSTVRAYSSVLAGERCDFPCRSASYALYRNGELIVRSSAIRPVKPTTA